MIIVKTSSVTANILMMISKNSLKQSSFTDHLDTNNNEGMLRKTLLDSNKSSRKTQSSQNLHKETGKIRARTTKLRGSLREAIEKINTFHRNNIPSSSYRNSAVINLQHKKLKQKSTLSLDFPDQHCGLSLNITQPA